MTDKLMEEREIALERLLENDPDYKDDTGHEYEDYKNDEIRSLNAK